MVYLVHYEGYFKHVKVKTFETAEHARWALDALKGAESTGIVIEHTSDLREIRAGKSLVDLYNALASEDDPVIDKFTSKADGQQKLFQRLEDKFRNQPFEPAPTSPTSEAPVPNEEPAKDTDNMVTKASKRKKAAKTKAPRIAKAKANGSNGVEKDAFGLRKGSKASQAAAMFARKSGATMAEAKDATGDTHYNVLNKLKEKGFKVAKEGAKLFLS